MHLTWILCVLGLQASLVAPHGGHVDEPGASSLSDALLSYMCSNTGVLCSGHGTCQQGVCICSSGYSGVKCEVPDGGSNPLNLGEVPPLDYSDYAMSELNLHDILGIDLPNINRSVSCMETDLQPCGGHGLCHDGVCACDEGYSGLTCELSSNTGFCHTYKECAECTARMIPCPVKCLKMANFKHVFGFPNASHGATFRTCRFKYAPKNCTYYFKEEREDINGRKTILVKACLSSQDATVGSNEAVTQVPDRLPLPDMTSRRVPVVPEVEEEDDEGTQNKQEGDIGNGQEVLTMSVLTVLSSLVLLFL